MICLSPLKEKNDINLIWEVKKYDFKLYTCMYILQDLEDSGQWLQEYPVTLMQFLLFLYHNQTDFVLLSTTTEFITSLASTLFPFNILDSDSNVTTPSEEFKVLLLT